MTTQKGGRLEHGSATEEAILSSAKVLAPNRAGQLTGLQQHFTDEQVAEFIASVVGTRHSAVDLSAGDGALLRPFPTPHRFGVELDKDQIEAARRAKQGYTAIHGDIQHVFPLLAQLGPAFDVALGNPSFGLSWNVPGLGEGSSTEMMVSMMRSVIREDGVGVLICGQLRFEREVRERVGGASGKPLSDHLFAVIQVERLFRGVKLPCVIAFWREGKYTRPYGEEVLHVAVESAKDLTEELADRVRKAHSARFGWWNHYLADKDAGRSWARTDGDLDSIFAAVQFEHARRTAARLAQPEYTVSLRGKRIAVSVSGFSMLTLAKANRREQINWLHTFNRQAVTYFALQNREWQKLRLLAEQDFGISIEPQLLEAVEAAIVEGRRAAIPMYPVSPAQRLGFLTDMDSILCVKSSAERKLVAGERYPIDCFTSVLKSTEVRERATVEEGRQVMRPASFLVERKGMSIRINNQSFSESAEDMGFVMEHFEVPNPGDLELHLPMEVAYWRGIVYRVEAEIQALVPGFRFRSFQVEDIVRLLVKGGGVLAWEQGLGKTLGQFTFTRALELAGRVPDECALFTMPPDLLQQFCEAAELFMGRKLVQVADLRDALVVEAMVQARREDLRAQRAGVHLAPRQGVWAITWFEALSRAGRIEMEKLPNRPVAWRLEWTKPRPGFFRGDEWVEGEQPKQIRVPIYSWAACPACKADAGNGWNGVVCKAKLKLPKGATARHRTCGYVDKRIQRKPAYTILSKLFRTVLVDEGTKIKGDDSLMSKAIRAFRPRYRLLATGTPIKNFVVDLFWLLWWALGDSSARFPYAYEGGLDRFEEDFAVIETRLDENGKKEGRPRRLPEVTNLMRLWKMLCSSVVRRKMEDVGVVVDEEGRWKCHACAHEAVADVKGPGNEWTKPEVLECEKCGQVADAIVPITFIPVHVPLGVEQQRFQAAWLDKDNFVDHFKAKWPDSPMCKHRAADALIALNAACLGQLAKLRYAAIDPLGDPDPDFKTPELSAWTPGRLEVLQIAEREVKAGNRVLIGSSLVAVGPWLTEQLQARGIRAIHITGEDSHGKVQTLSPKKRAKLLGDFRAGRAEVASVSAQAVALGHNLDCASVFIGYGLPDDFAGWDQLLKRVRRLSSKKPVRIYVVLPAGSLEERVWARLQDKGMAAELALDGKWSTRRESSIDKAAILREMQERGAVLTGEEVPEKHVERLWKRRGPRRSSRAAPRAKQAS